MIDYVTIYIFADQINKSSFFINILHTRLHLFPAQLFNDLNIPNIQLKLNFCTQWKEEQLKAKFNYYRSAICFLFLTIYKPRRTNSSCYKCLTFLASTHTHTHTTYESHYKIIFYPKEIPSYLTLIQHFFLILSKMYFY